MQAATVALMLALAAAPAETPRVVVLPLAAHEVGADELQQLESALHAALARISGVEVLPPAPARRSATQACAGEAACLVRLARELKADEVVHGEVSGLGDSYALTLRLLVVAEGRERASVRATINRDAEQMAKGARAQMVRLRAPALYLGRMAFPAEPDLKVEVDGKAMGAASIALAPGQHGVKLRRKGLQVDAVVEVRFEQTASVRLEGEPPKAVVSFGPWVPPALDEALGPLVKLEPATGPAAERPASRAEGGWARWPGIAAVAAGVALVGGGCAAIVVANDQRGQIEALRSPSGLFPVELAAEVRAREDGRRALWAGGMALAVVGAAVAAAGTTYLIVAPAPGGAQVAAGGTF